MRSSFRMARSCYSRIFVQTNAPQYCSFQPNRRQRMRRGLKRKRKHNHLLQTGSEACGRRTVERWQRNKTMPLVWTLAARHFYLVQARACRGQRRVATARLSCSSALSFSSPMRWRQRVSDERSNTNACWKNSSPQK